MKFDVSLFWAKTTDDKNNLERQNAFHPLICHLIDVSMSAQGIWENVLTETQRKRLAKPFALEKELHKAGVLLAFLVGLHDLGKCSPPFALRGKCKNQSEQTTRLYELYKNSDFDLETFPAASDARHEFVTSIVLPPILENEFKFPALLAKSVSDVIGGHHGNFPTIAFQTTNKNLKSVCGNETWREAQREIVEILAAALKVERHFPNLENKKIDNATAMIFAGFVTAADWVGSNSDFFKCEIADSTNIATDENFPVNAEKYLAKSKEKAREALGKLGWLNWISVTEEKNFEELFPNLTEPRHLQIVAKDIAKEIDSVGIVVVEEQMGEGKTETAMYLADVFNAVLKQRGIYFALPTQATSNQMFGRVESFLKHKHQGEKANVQLLLQHGHASISEEFAENVEDFKKLYGVFDESETRKDFANVVAAEWFTYKKRGLFVPFGVGTIDQILLGVLQVKHVFVRLFGLAHKTIIIDEVHAYDAYMSTLLERLLEWLAALSSPVIVLSATLPKNRRDALIKAYVKGLGQKFEDDDKLESVGEKDEYPRISYATAKTENKKFHIRHLGFPEHKTKTIYLEWKDKDTFVDELIAKLKANGGCVAIICNTVKEAQNTFAKLEADEFFQGNSNDDLPKLDLLHARFRFKDRDEREKRCLKRFGKPKDTKDDDEDISGGAKVENDDDKIVRPNCAVLVSTQIIEQSLDLDFDLMISELAPADLLLQRSGRLQRHNRPERILYKNAPTLWVLKPETDENGNLLKNKQNEPDFGASGIVYDKHILLRSWLKLRNCFQIEIPNDIEDLIEDIYDAERYFAALTDEEKEMWRTTAEIYRANSQKEEDIAQTIYLNSPHYKDHLGNFVRNPKEEDAPELHPAHQAQTRLVEPTANVVCLWEKDGEIFTDESYAQKISLTDKPNRQTAKKLLFNSVTISTKSVVFSLLRQEVPEGWRKFALLMRHRILIFDADGKCPMFGFVFHLDEKLGLRIYKEEEI
jgi:CRISPR-associated endonuclease/helicase Cas3